METSFLPGRAFTSALDFNVQLEGWLARANGRQHRLLGCRPVDRFETDRAAMLRPPPVTPSLGWRASVRLPRDYYIRLDGNDYSVHPSVIDRRVEVLADLSTVTVTCAGRAVAVHDRCWAKHQTITDPQHRAAADALQHLPRVAPPPPGGEVERRDLSDYDKAFGLTEEVA